MNDSLLLGVSIMNSLIPKENEVEDDVFPPRSTDIDIGPISHPPLIPEEIEEPQKTPPKPRVSELFPKPIPPAAPEGLLPQHPDPNRTLPETTQQRRGKLGRLVSQVFNRQDKRYPGLGFVQRCMGRARKSRVDSKVKVQLDNWQDHRPFFTWWVSTVQVLVLIFALVDNGFAEFGLDKEPTSKSFQYQFYEQQMHLEVPTNFYFGPTESVLIRLGAKYTPCMRRDKKIYDMINCERKMKKNTSCCINTSGNCLQTEESLCKNQFYKYLSYENYKKDNEDDYKKYYNGRISGTVCGLDPYHCGNKQNWENNQGQPNLIEFKPPNCQAINCSMDSEECREKRIACSHSREDIRWKDDITKWPVCTAKNITKLTEFPSIPIESMTCKIIARPCCIGVEGECLIAHQDFCEAHNGTFHKNKALCSQVSY
jgi:hypothetical protein